MAFNAANSAGLGWAHPDSIGGNSVATGPYILWGFSCLRPRGADAALRTPCGAGGASVVGREGKVQDGGQTGQQQPENGNRKPDRKIDPHQVGNIRCSSAQTED